jgi:hypothetical protein
LQHGLLYGAILSVLLSVLIVGSLYWRPMIWIGDAPKEVRAVAPPPTSADRRAKSILGVAFIAVLLGVIAKALLALRNLSGGALTFSDAFLVTFIIFETFNLVDLLIIDWLIVEWWRPSFITFPGAEGMNFFGGYGYHFRGFLIGTVMVLLGSLGVAGVAVWLLS